MRGELSSLQGAAKAKAEQAIKKATKALAILDDVLNGVGGKLEIQVAEPQRVAPTRPQDIDARNRRNQEMMTLLEAGVRKFQAESASLDTAISVAVVEMNNQGTVVSGGS